MTLSKVLTTAAIVCGAVATTIVSAGIATPVWLVPALIGTGTLAGKLSQSPLGSTELSKPAPSVPRSLPPMSDDILPPTEEEAIKVIHNYYIDKNDPRHSKK
jgi:hypothetical protein